MEDPGDDGNRRRSKRNKFHLDVAAIHGMPSSKKSNNRESPASTPPVLNHFSETLSVKVDSPSPAQEEVEAEEEGVEEETAAAPAVVEPATLTPTEGKRARRPVHYRNLALYGYSDDMLDDDVGIFGTKNGTAGQHLCTRCPARWETKAGLVNHVKMHGGRKRHNACELCDFSSNSMKAYRHHQRVHDLFGVLSAQPSPMDKTPDKAPKPESTDDGDEDTPPLLTPEVQLIQEDVSMEDEESTDTAGESSSSKPTPTKKTRMNKKCAECPYETRSNARLDKHMLGHTRASGFVCPVDGCNFKNESQSLLKRHVEIHVDAARTSWPPKYVGERPNAEEAATEDDVEDPPPLILNETMLSTKVNLDASDLSEQRNMTISTMSDDTQRMPLRSYKIRDGQFACDVTGCQFKAFARNSLAAHKIRTHHYFNRTSNSWMCNACGGRFKTAHLLRAHRLLRHRRSMRKHHRPMYLCEQVGIDFLWQATYPELYRKVEENKAEVVLSESASSPAICLSIPTTPTGNNFKCRYCNYTISSQSRLEQHEKKHLSKHPFTCKFCTFSCRDQTLITKHELRVHGAPYKDVAAPSTPDASIAGFYIESDNCELLDLPLEVLAEETVPTTSSSITSLSEAKKNHYAMKNFLASRAKPLPSSAISIKVTSEDGTKRTRCIECPYETRFLGDMRSHRAMHSMSAQYRCSQCSYSTKRNASLRQHIVSHQKYNEKHSINHIHPLVNSDKICYGQRRGAGQRRIYTCDKCPYVSSTLVVLWRHSRRHFFASRFNACSACSYSSDDFDRMEDHQLIHPDGTANIVQLEQKEDSDNFAEMPVLKEEPSTSSELQETTVRELLTKTKGKGKKRKSELVIDRQEVEKEAKKKAPSPITVLAVRAPSGRSTKGKRKEHADFLNEFLDPIRRPLEYIENAENSGEANKKPEILPFNHAVSNAMRWRAQEKDIAERKTCPDCGFSDKSSVVFKQHRAMHFREGCFQCEMCTFSCSSGEVLASHYAVHTDPPFGELRAKMLEHRTAAGREKAGATITESDTKTWCVFCRSNVENHLFKRHWQNHYDQATKRNNMKMKRETTDDKRKRQLDYLGEPKQPYSAIREEASLIYCKYCNFHCKIPTALVRHREMHMQPGLYKCKLCNYQCNSKKVVDFHQQNHHLNVALKNEKESNDSTTVSTDDNAERVVTNGTLFCCRKCSFTCHHGPDLADHMEKSHENSTEEDRDELESVRLGLFNVSSIVSV